jgi:hypothetical protein
VTTVQTPMTWMKSKSSVNVNTPHARWTECMPHRQNRTETKGAQGD